MNSLYYNSVIQLFSFEQLNSIQTHRQISLKAFDKLLILTFMEWSALDPFQKSQQQPIYNPKAQSGTEITKKPFLRIMHCTKDKH